MLDGDEFVLHFLPAEEEEGERVFAYFFKLGEVADGVLHILINDVPVVHGRALLRLGVVVVVIVSERLEIAVGAVELGA
jgi:hypothetical protein